MKWVSTATILTFCVTAMAGDCRAGDLLETADQAGQFTMFRQAAEQVGLATKLTSPGPFTVFAPTDDAFRALPPDVLKRLMDPQNMTELANVLSYHVVAGRLAGADVKTPLNDLQALTGRSLFLRRDGDTVFINDATVVRMDIIADNGVIHMVDKVLVPPTRLQPSFESGR